MGETSTMRLRKKYAWAWIIWILSFAIIEFKAILDDDKAAGDYTLTHYIRRLIGAKGKAGKWRWSFRLFLAGLVVWFVPHFNYFGLL